MPYVTAPPRSLQNGEVITEFTDTTSTVSVTYTYPIQQSALTIENSGVADIIVSVGSYTSQVVKPDKTWRADVLFTSFTIRSTTNSQEFIATAFLNDIEDSGIADSVARAMATAAKRGKINVKDFGALGNGADDDAQAIQKAVNAAKNMANALLYGVEVYLPAGKYKTTSSITVFSRLRLTGAGMGNTILLPHGSGFPAINGNGTAAAPMTDIEVSFMTIDGANVTDASYNISSKAIYNQFVKRMNILYVHCLNTNATSIGTDHMQDCVIHGCVVENYGRMFNGSVGGNGIGIGSGALSDRETLVISDCHIFNNNSTGNNGIMFENQDENAQYSGYAEIVNCTIRGGQVGIRNSGNMRMRFSGNMIVGCIKDGVYLSDGLNFGTSPYQAYETQITHNQIYSCGRYGITFQRVNAIGSFLVSGNHIAGNADHGIYVNTDIYNSRFSGNLIYNNGNNGIYCTNTCSMYDSVVNDNTIYGNNFNGIGFYNGAIRTDIIDNKIFNNGKTVNQGSLERDAIKIVAATQSITSVRIIGNSCYDYQTTKTQRRGISLGANGAGTLSFITIENNDVNNNQSTKATSISIATSPNTIVRNNPGYNPVGTSAITVGASPFTYTAGNTPETIHIEGGTVSQISKNSVTLASVTGRTVRLEPNESITVTYSVAPTMIADKH